MNPKLVQCPACSSSVSEHAVTCPHCGQPLGVGAGLAGQRPLKRAEKVAIVAAGLSVGGVLWYLAATGQILR